MRIANRMLVSGEDTYYLTDEDLETLARACLEHANTTDAWAGMCWALAQRHMRNGAGKKGKKDKASSLASTARAYCGKPVGKHAKTPWEKLPSKPLIENWALGRLPNQVPGIHDFSSSPWKGSTMKLGNVFFGHGLKA